MLELLLPRVLEFYGHIVTAGSNARIGVVRIWTPGIVMPHPGSSIIRLACVQELLDPCGAARQSTLLRVPEYAKLCSYRGT